MRASRDPRLKLTSGQTIRTYLQVVTVCVWERERERVSGAETCVYLWLQVVIYQREGRGWVSAAEGGLLFSPTTVLITPWSTRQPPAEVSLIKIQYSITFLYLWTGLHIISYIFANFDLHRSSCEGIFVQWVEAFGLLQLCAREWSILQWICSSHCWPQVPISTDCSTFGYSKHYTTQQLHISDISFIIAVMVVWCIALTGGVVSASGWSLASTASPITSWIPLGGRWREGRRKWGR